MIEDKDIGWMVLAGFLAFGAFFYGHEFGMTSGAKIERDANKTKLEGCMKIVSGSIYAR